MSEMIERLALVLCKSDGDCRCAGSGGTSSICHVVEFKGVARAAVAAMREPTDGMLDAADEPFHDEWRKQKASSLKTYGKEGYGSSTFSSRIWDAMIEEALK